ncbi:acyl-CoA-binding domain-containing protein 6-like isoform X2 [Ostrea edulis]|nr:acyl-CoA-binding domain-containing protein 6-like isoform X2 [Ostrea edulis]XP_056011165.1 acyl-CoA-binding domain-containing protein 6-like isoform X2 [Ostrea edulis]XP_056011166.1 acyl-CoA-binding domain-containing protein 6-like isoform X2 [Ostrea edulis]
MADDDDELGISDEDHDDLSELFQLATAFVRLSSDSFNQEQLLYLYSRFKQANDGPCNVPKPGMFDFQGKKKWEAWKSLENKSKEEAKREYISKVMMVTPDWNTKQLDRWVGVSTMSNTDTVIEDEKKTAFDWCKEGNTSHLVRYLKNTKTDVNIQDENGMTLLHWTCDRGNLEMLNALLDLEVDPNIQDNDGQSALHYAVSCEHQDIVDRLLKTRMNLKLKDMDGLTVLDIDTNSEIKQMLEKNVT